MSEPTLPLPCVYSQISNLRHEIGVGSWKTANLYKQIRAYEPREILTRGVSTPVLLLWRCSEVNLRPFGHQMSQPHQFTLSDSFKPHTIVIIMSTVQTLITSSSSHGTKFEDVPIMRSWDMTLKRAGRHEGPVTLNFDIWTPNSNQFNVESKWTFAPYLKTFPQRVLEISRSQQWNVKHNASGRDCFHHEDIKDKNVMKRVLRSYLNQYLCFVVKGRLTWPGWRHHR